MKVKMIFQLDIYNRKNQLKVKTRVYILTLVFYVEYDIFSKSPRYINLIS